MSLTANPLAALRERLVRLEFHVRGRVGFLNSERGTPEQRLENLLEATDDGAPISTALRLFTLGVPVSTAQAAASVGPELVPALVEAGLLRREGDRVRSTAAISFVGEIAAAEDFTPHRPEDDVDDFVAPIALGSRILSLFSVPKPGGGGRLLEIGTGQGYPITAASPAFRSAIGTDISPRAIECARITAQLNGRGNIEFRQGNLFEPLDPKSDVFDSIMVNPPYVIVPTDDTGAVAGGDATLTEQIVRGIPPFLAEGGFATVLGNWGHAGEADWAHPVRDWVQGSGCDAMVIRFRTESPHAYVQTWRRELRTLRPFREPAPVASWLEMFRSMGVGAITLGLIVLGRRAGRNWFHELTRNTAGIQPGAGAQLRRVFAARTRLFNTASPADLLAQPAQLAPCELSGRPMPRGPGEWGVFNGTLRQTEGWPEPVAVDPLALAILMGTTSRKPLHAVTAAAAEAKGMSPSYAQEMIRNHVSRWFELGYLS
ncbi:MAG: methyltransferase domain-containing protein [Phycisphaeraceae bacterium]|nr:methyltransferase domain-containing protein [Phycisphaeraceae bacterium]